MGSWDFESWNFGILEFREFGILFMFIFGKPINDPSLARFGSNISKVPQKFGIDRQKSMNKGETYNFLAILVHILNVIL